MIEAAELATPTQRRLHQHYAEIHRKFFPKEPTFPQFIAPPPALIPPPPPVAAKPALLPPPPKPIGPEQVKLRMRIIRRMVCQAFDITRETLMSTRRTDDIVRPRHVYSYMAARLTRASLPQIAHSLKQDHTTILHAIRRIEARIALDYDMRIEMQHLESRIRDEFGETNRPRNIIGRYVRHDQVPDYFMLGWMWAANLNEYAALMIWPCSCDCAEPRE
jgi:Bacterial dnaA protein helix-turn-helix